MKPRKTTKIENYMHVFMPTQSYIMGKYVPPSREEIVECIDKYANDCREMDRKINAGTVSRMIWPELAHEMP